MDSVPLCSRCNMHPRVINFLCQNCFYEFEPNVSTMQRWMDVTRRLLPRPIYLGGQPPGRLENCFYYACGLLGDPPYPRRLASLHAMQKRWGTWRMEIYGPILMNWSVESADWPAELEAASWPIGFDDDGLTYASFEVRLTPPNGIGFARRIFRPRPIGDGQRHDEVRAPVGTPPEWRKELEAALMVFQTKLLRPGGRPPKRLKVTLDRITATYDTLSVEWDRPPTKQEVASKLKVSPTTIDRRLKGEAGTTWEHYFQNR